MSAQDSKNSISQSIGLSVSEEESADNGQENVFEGDETDFEDAGADIGVV
jgi:hypothetical protein